VALYPRSRSSRGYPSGAILLWETDEDVPLQKFAVEQVGNPYQSVRLLLDGQQRLTSLSAVIRGQPVTDAQPLARPRTPPAGYKEYRSDFYRFQMFYPDDLAVTLIHEKDSAATITFQNADHSQSLQIFVMPYGDPKISKERFKTDLPSGIIDQPTNISIDGAAASEFYSKDATLGDTYEVWFVGRGFLYEVTTYKELSDWLKPLMGSWQFL
jgi:hypothetical protein